MKTEKNIFDLENIKDIPKSCEKNLRILRLSEDVKNLFNLFDKKNRLTVDEVIVAMYRLHKLDKDRSWVNSSLYNLARKNLIKKVPGAIGSYEKVS